jgi:hypothetical protein
MLRMYRPHAAREGTMPFPAFREVVGGKGYRELGEPFDDREHKLCGKEGFESVVRDVAGVRHARSPEEVHAPMTLTWLVALVGVIGGTMTAIAGVRTEARSCRLRTAHRLRARRRRHISAGGERAPHVPASRKHRRATLPPVRYR